MGILEKTNWSNYSDESIDFIFSQAEKLLDETFTSFREITNRSYGALAIYISILSYCFNKIANINPFCWYSAFPYLIIIIGLVLCILIIWSNLLPKKMKFPGAEPNKLLDPILEKYKDKQLRLSKIRLIKWNDNSIYVNHLQIDKMIKKFKLSIYCFGVSILLYFFMFYLIHQF